MKRSMRTCGAVAAVALLLGVLPAAAEDDWRPTAGGWVSGPVEHVETVLTETGTGSDGVLHDGYLYVSTWRSFSIYDVSDPLQPVLRSTTPLVVGVYNESPQTNGDILLLSRDFGYLPGLPPELAGGPLGAVRERVGGLSLDIYDVRDKSAPVLLGTYISSRHDHLWTCVLECRYAYSASGTILDLGEPAAPVPVGDWSQQAPYRPGRYHHIAEVAPGIVMTGSLPLHILDARTDPTAPSLMASTEPATTEPMTPLMEESLPARVAWPGATRRRLALVSMETPFSGPCTDQSGDFQTFVTTGWRGTGTFQPADRYQLASNGTFVDGNPPANAVGCSAYGMKPHPGFGATGGSVAVAFFEHGVRILDVDGKGRIAEVGGYLPHAGNSAAVLWPADDVLYVIDLHRGIDILRVR